MICVKSTAFCDLRAYLRIRLTTLSKSVRKFWFCKLALTCVNVRVRLARALQRRKSPEDTAPKCYRSNAQYFQFRVTLHDKRRARQPNW